MSSNRGVMGMLGTVDKNQQAKENLATLENLSNFVDGKRKQEQENQVKLAMFKEQISKEANELLGHDKTMINDYAKKSFGIIKDKIRAYGGNLEKFYSEGGISLLSDYKNSVLNSSTMARFQENKKNMETLLELEKKGMGHLINPVDRASMDNYRLNKGGDITYTGQLIDIEMPPSDQFDINTDAGIEYIVGYSNNRLKLTNNYMKSFPHLGQPSDTDLKDYAKQLYRVKGTNTHNSQMEYKIGRDAVDDAFRDRQQTETEKNNAFNRTQASLEYELNLKIQELNKQMMAGQGQGSQGQGSGITDSESYIANTAESLNAMGRRQVTINDINEPDFWDRVLEEHDDLARIGLSDWNVKGTGQSFGKLGHNFGAITGAGSKYSLRGAKKIEDIDSNAALKASGLNFVDGKFTTTNKEISNSSFYDYSGERYKGTAGDETINKTFTPKGVVVAMTYTDEKGEQRLLTDKHNVLSGRPNSDFRAKVDAAVGKTNLVPKTFIAVQDEKGYLYYKEVDLSNARVMTRYQRHDPDDDIAKAKKTYSNASEKRKQSELTQQERESQQYQSFLGMMNNQNALQSILKESTFIGNPLKKGTDRASFTASYYATLAGSTGDPNNFETFTSQGLLQEHLDRLANKKLNYKGKKTSIYEMTKEGYSDEVIISTLINIDEEDADFWREVRKNLTMFKK